MTVHSIAARALAIPLRTSFRHASAARRTTASLWVRASDGDGNHGWGEGCPREYVTGESVEGALRFVERHRRDWLAAIDDVNSLRAWLAGHGPLVDANPAAWCAVELALLDLLARRAGRTVEAILDLPPLSGTFRYSAVIGDDPKDRFERELRRYLEAGFRSFKIKLSGSIADDQAKVAALRASGVDNGSVRADANNLWTDADQATTHLSALDYPFAALEEPLRPRDHAGMERIAAVLGCALILDESVTRADDLAAIPDSPARRIVNLRLSKMGGLLRSLDLLGRIRTRPLGVIVGAHVGETSLLTRAALTVADRSRDLLLYQEGAFGTHLLEHDAVTPSITFGPGGVLRAESVPADPGFGLTVEPPYR